VASKRAGITELFSGLGAAVLFGTLYGFTGTGFFLFLGVVFGVLPGFRGISKILQARVTSKEQKQIQSRSSEIRERIVLNLARDNHGKLTPAIVAVNSEVTIDQAEAQLREFADKGYAELEVTEDGRIEYIFPEFLPRLEE